MNHQARYTMMLFALPFVLFSCRDDDTKGRLYDITGYVQKGPFIMGTSVGISQLTSALKQTGRTFFTEIADNRGAFEVNDVELTSSFVQLSANGYYFDEVKGEVSPATLTLNALADLSNSSKINVNVLTHLEKRRVEYLLDENHSFSSAKTTAQTEILSAFGIRDYSISDSDMLDITSDDEGGGILLAISVILQGNRTVGELAEVLAAIADDMRPDGSLDNKALLNSLRLSAKALDLAAVTTHLSDRYEQLGIPKAVPDFKTYVNAFLTSTGDAPTSTTLPATNVEAYAATLSGMTNANSLNTTVTFEYGITPEYGSAIQAMPNSIAGHREVSVSSKIIGLSPGTTYHFRITSENSKGVTHGDDMTFTTLGQVPIAVTQKVTGIEPTQVRVDGLVNPNDLPTIITFEYGTTLAYGNSIPATIESPLQGNTNTPVSAIISGLLTGQTYYFRIKAENELGEHFGEPIACVPFYAIGSSFQGGLLAYVFQPDDPGHEPGVAHGLIVAPADIEFNDTYPHLDDFTTPWTGSDGEWYQQIETGATGAQLGDGKGNTDLIVAAYGSGGYYAAVSCYNFTINGYDDWFLPSLGELLKLNENRGVLFLFYGGLHGHWSSTEYNGWQSWLFKFGISDPGVAVYADKDSYGKVRPMRYF